MPLPEGMTEGDINRAFEREEDRPCPFATGVCDTCGAELAEVDGLPWCDVCDNDGIGAIDGTDPSP